MQMILRDFLVQPMLSRLYDARIANGAENGRTKKTPIVALKIILQFSATLNLTFIADMAKGEKTMKDKKRKPGVDWDIVWTWTKVIALLVAVLAVVAIGGGIAYFISVSDLPDWFKFWLLHN
jgi:hypothetical protein